MARYSDKPKKGEPTASLILQGWHAPETWEGATAAPDQWPHAAVQSLINLFTDPYPCADPEEYDDYEGGTAIPELLGHHIAVLIDDWCNLRFELDIVKLMYPCYSLSTWLREDVRANLQYVKLVLQNKAHRSNYIQTWYSQGIALFQPWATSPHPWHTDDPC